MRIDCPTCQAAYDVPDAVIAAGRTLRCARCSADFMPAAAPAPESLSPNQPAVSLQTVSPASVAPAPTPPPPAQPPEPAFIPQSVPERVFVPPAGLARLADPERPDPAPALAVAAAWALSFVVLGSMGWVGVTYRTSIAHAWPPATRVYAALGYKY